MPKQLLFPLATTHLGLTLVLSLIKNQDIIYSEPFTRIIYCLPSDVIHLHQEFLAELRAAYPKIEIVESLSAAEELQLTATKEKKLCVFDDQGLNLPNPAKHFSLMHIDHFSLHHNEFVPCFQRTFHVVSEENIFFSFEIHSWKSD